MEVSANEALVSRPDLNPPLFRGFVLPPSLEGEKVSTPHSGGWVSTPSGGGLVSTPIGGGLFSTWRRSRWVSTPGGGGVGLVGQHRQAEEARSGSEERRSDHALGQGVGGILRRALLNRLDGAAMHTPAEHRVAHGHPSGFLGQALARGAIEHRLRVEVEEGGP